VIVTDTVGFIRDLPPDLVAAFRATLEELREADLFLHVVDASEDFERRIAAVRRVLGEIGLAETPELLVFNKIDRLAPGTGRALAERNGAVPISALGGSGLDALLERAEDMLPDAQLDVGPGRWLEPMAVGGGSE
jgi:GTP-binding protein HflX